MGAAAADRADHERGLLPAVRTPSWSRRARSTTTRCWCCSPRWRAAWSSASWPATGRRRSAATACRRPSRRSCMGGSKVQPRVAVLKPVSVRGRDRHRRPVRRRGPDHHDRRRDRFAVRPVPAPDRRRAQDPAGRRRDGRHGGHVQRAAGRAVLAVELLLFEWRPRSLRPGRGRGRGRDASSAGRCSAPPRCSRRGRRPHHDGDVRAVRRLRLVVRAARDPGDRAGLRLRGRLPAAADPLDVVAGDRRTDHRHRRPDRAAGARRRLRHHRRRADRLDRPRPGRRHPHREDADLVVLPRFGHLRRRAGADVHDRRRAGLAGGARLPARRAGLLGAHRRWPASSAG